MNIESMLTDEELEVYKFIRYYFKVEGFSPSRREIAAAVALSTYNVNIVLKSLMGKGLIKYYPRKPRTIAVISR